MPKEKFYLSGQVEGDGNPPDFTVSWGTDHDGDSTTLITGPDEKPYIIAKPNDTAGLSRLIKALTRARTHMIQNRGAQPLVEVPDFLKVDNTKPKPRPVELIDNGPDQMPTHWAAIPGTVLGEDDLVEWLAAAPPLTVIKDCSDHEWKRSQHTNPSHQWVGIGHRGLSTHERLAERGPLTYVGTLGMQR